MHLVTRSGSYQDCRFGEWKVHLCSPLSCVIPIDEQRITQPFYIVKQFLSIHSVNPFHFWFVLLLFIKVRLVRSIQYCHDNKEYCKQ